MPKNQIDRPLPARDVPRSVVDVGGVLYVLVAKVEFDRLCLQADGTPVNAAPFGRGFLGPDLRARRLKTGLTLTDLARRAGIRLETLSRIENGRTDPSSRTVQSILKALEESAA